MQFNGQSCILLQTRRPVPSYSIDTWPPTPAFAGGPRFFFLLLIHARGDAIQPASENGAAIGPIVVGGLHAALA
jgi:hypothetical protein